MATEPSGLEARMLSTPNNNQSGLTTPSNVSVTNEKETDKEIFPEDDDVDSHEGGKGEESHDLARVESAQYPTAWKLVGILVAICLSILLVALDMVSLR
jgi:hypothetical protein